MILLLIFALDVLIMISNVYAFNKSDISCIG